MIRDALYQHYYDESHFYKDFKRMTGYSPAHYRSYVANEFGRILTLRQRFSFLQDALKAEM
jgi:AraC-like DNA-binding protein